MEASKYENSDRNEFSTVLTSVTNSDSEEKQFLALQEFGTGVTFPECTQIMNKCFLLNGLHEFSAVGQCMAITDLS